MCRTSLPGAPLGVLSLFYITLELVHAHLRCCACICACGRACVCVCVCVFVTVLAHMRACAVHLLRPAPRTSSSFQWPRPRTLGHQMTMLDPHSHQTLSCSPQHAGWSCRQGVILYLFAFTGGTVRSTDRYNHAHDERMRACLSWA